MKKILVLTAVLSITILNISTTFAAPLSTDSDLIAHWSFDEGTGTEVTDDSGNGKDGTMTTDITWIDGKVGAHALSFGDNNKITFSPFNVGTQNSVSVWIKGRDDVGPTGMILAMDNAGNPGGSFGYMMYIEATDPSGTGNAVYYNDSQHFATFENVDLSGDEWIHLTLSRNEGVVTMYKNGVQHGDTQTLTFNAPLNSITSIGEYTSTPYHQLHADIDDLRVYNKPLSESEVKEIYNLGTVVENTSPTIELNGQEIVDLYVGDVFTDEGVSMNDNDALEDLILSTSTNPEGGVNTNATGTISLIYTVTDTGGLSASTTRTINIIATTTPEVSTTTSTTTAPVITEETVKEVSKNKSGSRARISSLGSVLGAFSYGGGQVLGAFSGPVSSTTPNCSAYLDGSLIGVGYENKPAEVEKLKAFLNEYLGSNIDMNGKFDAETVTAIKEFQNKFKSEIITPWFKLGLLKNENPTGFVNKMTIRKINNIICPALSLPLPTLN